RPHARRSQDRIRCHRRRRRPRRSSHRTLHPRLTRRTPPMARRRRAHAAAERRPAMSVRRRKWIDSDGAQREAWVVDVQAAGKDGLLRRSQRVCPVQTRRAAEKLEHALRVELLNKDVKAPPPAEIPMFAEFAEQFIETYAVTNN